MTLKEFEEAIDSIDVDQRDDGKYTRDEIYDLGCKFIEMTPAEKRQFGGWDKLVEILQPLDKNGEVMKKGDTLRVWVKSTRYAKDEMIHDERLISGKTIDDITFEEFENQTEAIKQNLYKQQVKTRDHMNAYRSLIREDARIELMKDLIKESISSLPPLEFNEKEKYEIKNDAEAVLLFSDLHIGCLVDNFFNKYNLEIARRRVKEVVQQTIKYCKVMGVKKLNVLNLGDLIENDLHLSARLIQEMDAIDQTTKAAEILSESLKELAESIPEVTYRSCLDNHSRYIMDYKSAKDEESLVKLIDWYVESRLENTNIVFENDNLDRHIGLFTLMNGDKFAFAHGHEIPLNISVQSYAAATYSYIKYVALGHWHTTKMKTFFNSKVFVNGSIKGLDDYAEKHGYFAEPEQTLLIFDGDNLTNITINLKNIK